MGFMLHKIKCQVCNKGLESKHTGTLYCSNACRQKSFRDKRNGTLKSLRNKESLLNEFESILDCGFDPEKDWKNGEPRTERIKAILDKVSEKDLLGRLSK